MLARLNDEELRIYKRLLRSVAGTSYSKNKSASFRKLLKAMDRLFQERKDEKLEEKIQEYLKEWPDFDQAVATKGPEVVEVEGPEEIERLEEGD